MIILKTINPKVDGYDKREKEAFKYCNKLIEQGWVENITEGCYISPDHSTCFEYNRCPYYGQLHCYSEYKKEEYNKICEELIRKGDFISYNN